MQTNVKHFLLRSYLWIFSIILGIPSFAQVPEALIDEDRSDVLSSIAWAVPAEHDYEEVDGVLRVSFHPFQGNAFLKKNFELKAGNRYFLGAKVRCEDETYAYLRLTGEVGNLPKKLNYVYPSSEWQETGYTFNTYSDQNATGLSGKAKVELRLYAPTNMKRNSVYFKDFVLYELDQEYGVWIRVKLLNPPQQAKVNLRYLRHSGTETQDWVEDRFGTLVPNEWSPWATYDDILSASGRYTGTFYFNDALTGKELTNVKAQFQVAYKKDVPSSVFFDGIEEVKGGHIGMVLPEANLSVNSFPWATAFLNDRLISDIEAYYDTQIPPAIQPTHLWLGTQFSFRPDHLDYVLGDTLADSEEAMATAGLFQDMGLSAATINSGTAYGAGNALKNFGLNGSMYFWNTWDNEWLNETNCDSCLKEYNLAAQFEAFEENAKRWIKGNKAMAPLFRDDPKRAVLNTGDEIFGLSFGGKGYEDEFHQFLISKGFSPGDFGVQDWEEIKAIPEGATCGKSGPCMRYNDLKDQIRHDGGDMYENRLWYWQMLFWNEATADTHNQVTQIAETNAQWGAEYPVAPNLGDTWHAQFLTLRRGVEPFTFARKRAVSMIWTDTWVNWYSDRYQGNQLVGMLADYARAAANHGSIGFGSYIMPGSPMDLKALSLVARGATHLQYYNYGPYDLQSTDTFAGPGTQAKEYLLQITQTNDLIARNEDILFEGERPQTRIAMLASQTDPLWTGRNATSKNEQGIYFALTHGHYPIDFLCEEDVVNGALNNYSLFFVDVSYIRDDAFAAIMEWVEEGGILHLGFGDMGKNEYAQTMRDDRLEKGLGLTFGEIRQTTGMNVSWRDHEIKFDGKYRQLEPYDGVAAKVVAHFSDTEEIAALDIPSGAGKVRAVGFPIGEAYLRGVIRLQQLFQTRYQESVRAALLELPESQWGGKRPVWTNNPYVEAHRVEQGDEFAIILLNYNNTPVEELEITIPGFTGQLYSTATESPIYLETNWEIDGGQNGLTYKLGIGTLKSLDRVDVLRSNKVYSDQLVPLQEIAPEEKEYVSHIYNRTMNFAFYAQPDRDVRFKVAVSISKNKVDPADVVLTVWDSSDVAIHTQNIPVSTMPEIVLPGLDEGLYRFTVEVFDASERFRIFVPSGLHFVQEGAFKINTYQPGKKQYFFVPRGVKRVFLDAQRTSVIPKFYAPDDYASPVQHWEEEGTLHTFDVNGQDGQVWAFSDVHLAGKAWAKFLNVPNVFALSPTQLLVPEEVHPDVEKR